MGLADLPERLQLGLVAEEEVAPEPRPRELAVVAAAEEEPPEPALVEARPVGLQARQLLPHR